MTRHRRALLVAVVLVSTVGCLGFLTGSQALEFSANETVVSDAALDETGYQEAGNQTVTNVINVTVAGQTRQANLTSYRYTYNRTVDESEVDRDGLGALPENGTVPVANTSDGVSFSVVATPNARVGGQSVHPLARVSPEDLVQRFLETGNTSVRFEGNRTVASLGAERTVSTFRLEGETNASDAVVHVATFDAGTDFVITFAVHPGIIDEQDRVDTLIAGLERPFV
ncbi:hypothetical protein BRC67_04560 [Halobacteriales archaeon QH_3_68_24]|nr:MAG: hypothetical protein BRC67_04560 [Halobacteriales archaeon QH_3_68_24]